MAAPVGTTTRYSNPNAIREDLEDIVYNISPMDTIALTTFGRSTASSTLHEWQTDALAAAVATNAQVEGDDLSGTARADTVRLRNYTQISTKPIIVSGTMDAVRQAGIGDRTGYHVMMAMKELKRDVETSILQNNAATAGAAASARVSGSVENWINTALHIIVSASASTAAYVGGIASGAVFDGTGTGTAFVEGALQSALAVAWANGGETDLVLMPARQKTAFNAFSGIATRFRDVAAGQQADIVAAADIYVSSYGSHQVRLSRYMRNAFIQSVFCLDTTMWGVAYLRPFQVIDVARTGDATKKLALAEWTLVARNPTSSTKIHALF